MSSCQQTLSLKTKQEKSQTWHNGYNLDHKLTEASCGETLLNIHKLYQSKKSLHMYTTKMSRSQLSLEYLLLQAKIFLLEAYKDTHACIHQNLTWTISLKISYVRMWDDYHVFLIATLVFTRLILDEMYHLIKLPFDWLMLH